MSTSAQTDRFLSRHGKSITIENPQSGQTDNLGNATEGTPTTSDTSGVIRNRTQEPAHTDHGEHPSEILGLMVADDETVYEHEDDQPASNIVYDGKTYEVQAATDLGNGWIFVEARR